MGHEFSLVSRVLGRASGRFVPLDIAIQCRRTFAALRIRLFPVMADADLFVLPAVPQLPEGYRRSQLDRGPRRGSVNLCGHRGRAPVTCWPMAPAPG